MRSAAQVAAAVAMVRARIAAAAQQRGRGVPVTLVAVSKRQPFEMVQAAYAAGVRDFGENLAQELRHKAALAQAQDLQVRWHFIGRLQRNKAPIVVAHAAATHSVDSLALLGALAKAQARLGVAMPHEVFVQVNMRGEAQKGGVAPTDALDLCAQVGAHGGLRLAGLMTVPPQGSEPAPTFVGLATLAEQVRHKLGLPRPLALSMGMSEDFEAAIGCGATCVRLGRTVFGARPAPAPPES